MINLLLQPREECQSIHSSLSIPTTSTSFVNWISHLNFTCKVQMVMCTINYWMKQSCNSSKFRAASHFLHISAEYVTIKISVASSFFLTLTGQSLHVLTASTLENIPSAFAKHVLQTKFSRFKSLAESAEE